MMDEVLGLLVSGGVVGRKSEVHRVVGVFPEINAAFVSRIQGEERPSGDFPKRVPLDTLVEQLHREVCVHKESVRYAWMELPEDELQAKFPGCVGIRNRHLERYAGLFDKKLLQQEERLMLCFEILSNETRGQALKVIAKKANICVENLYPVVKRVLAFGPTRNALLAFMPLSGGKGQRRSKFAIRTGRRNVFALRAPSHPFAGAKMSKYHEGKCRRALEMYFVGLDMSLAETYREMRRTLYVQTMPDGHGGVVTYPVAPGKIISFEQFYEFYRWCRSNGEFVEDKAGLAELEKNRKAYPGSSTDIVDGPLDVYDMDGTGGKIELVAMYDRQVHIGCPLYVIAVDRGSDAIVGASVTIFGESTDAYKRCLYIAYTKKDKLLEILGLPSTYWPEYGQSNAVYVDQGPGSSKESEKAFVYRLSRGRFVAPARTPRAKPLVEGINDKIHDSMAAEPGGYNRSRDGMRKEERRKSARARAGWTRRECWIRLIELVHEHNTTTDVSHLLTPEMRRDGIRGFPCEIFEWGKQQRAGAEVQEFDAAELAKLLLAVDHRCIEEDGIHYKNRTFWSAEIGQLRYEHQCKHAHWAKLPKLSREIYVHPYDPNTIFWEPEPGRLAEIGATEASQKQVVEMTLDDWLDCTARDRESAIIGRNRIGPKRGLLTKRQKEILLEIGKNRRAGVVERETIRANRALEQLLERKELAENLESSLFPTRQRSMTPPAGKEERAPAIEPNEEERLMFDELFEKMFGERA